MDSEDGRAFLQDRIALFSRVGFSLSVFFLVVSHALMRWIPGHVWPDCLGSHLWHAAGSGVLLGFWLLTRRGSFSHRALTLIDAAAIVLSMAAYVGMGLSAHVQNMRTDLVLVLIMYIVLMLRAVLLPSTPAHTAFVTFLAAVPVVGFAYYSTVNESGPLTPGFAVANAGMWCFAALIVCVLTSRIIYGLRAEVVAARRFGQYVLEEKIGEGGMGSVYRARHALLRRPTAVKLVHPEKTGADTLARFEREVQLTAMLTHPNTVHIYDYGRTPDGVFYYAMEYLDGVDLEELVRRFGPQDPSRVVHILSQVAGSLSEAHSIGLVHRDIKPANIVLCERGGIPDTAKVVDFGLVKDVSSTAIAASLSRVNAVIGTPLYMAPEALLAPNEIDARADLYALGAVGYYLLTGVTLFEGSSMIEIGAQQLHGTPVSPSERLGSPVPADLEALILACLAKKPSDRPATACALRDALEACNVPRWTPTKAREWWESFGDRARSKPPEPKIESARSPQQVPSSLGARAAAE